MAMINTSEVRVNVVVDGEHGDRLGEQHDVLVDQAVEAACEGCFYACGVGLFPA